MKITQAGFLVAVGLSAVLPGTFAAEPPPPPKAERKPLRVLTPAERERRPMLPRPAERRDEGEKETVAFLGVETGPVSAVLGAQLGLGRGTGLVVHHVVPKSPAEGRLQEHDVLLKLDDQLLIDTRQLAVLVRLRKEGDDVALTYLRAGKQATVTIKLGRTEVPKHAIWQESGGLPMAVPGGAGRVEFFRAPAGPEEERGEVDRVLSMLRRRPDAGPTRIEIEREGGPGFRAMAVRTDNSTLTIADEAGSLELTFRDGAKSLVAKNPAGEEIFSGPVTTPAEREALPPDVRTRLERLEGMRDLTFRTGEEFRGAETRVIRPRSIAAPPWERLPGPPAPDVL